MVTEDADVRRERLEHEGWIGVDLDGTLAHYDRWVGWNVFGAPIAPMVARVRGWLAEGRDVRVLTARIGLPAKVLVDGTVMYHGMRSGDEWHLNECKVTGRKFSDHMMLLAVQDWTQQYCGARLRVQCYKDTSMIELWDDRAVQVVPNTGQTLAEVHAAELSALRGAP